MRFATADLGGAMVTAVLVWGRGNHGERGPSSELPWAPDGYADGEGMIWKLENQNSKGKEGGMVGKKRSKIYVSQAN